MSNERDDVPCPIHDKTCPSIEKPWWEVCVEEYDPPTFDEEVEEVLGL